MGPTGVPDQMLVVVSVAMQFEAVESKSVTASYGGISMNEVAFYAVGGPGGVGSRAVKLFYLKQQHVALDYQHIKINWSGVADKAQDFVCAAVSTYYGVDQNKVPPVFGNQEEQVPSKVGNLVQDIALFAFNTTPVATGTLLWLNQSTVAQAGSQYKPGASSVLMEWLPPGPSVLVAGAIEIVQTPGSRAPTTLTPTFAPTTSTPTTSSPTNAPSTSFPSSSSPSVAPTTTAPSSRPPSIAPSRSPTTLTSVSPSLSPLPPPQTPTPTAPTEQAASESHVIRYVLITISILAVFVFVGGAYYICRLRRRVYTAEELFLAPSDFARLMGNHQSADEPPDPDTLDFSESRPSHSAMSTASNFASTHF